MEGKAPGLKSWLLLGLLLLISLKSSPVFSDTVQYIYDNMGRLVMTVSSSGTVIMYGYDDAGRLISTTRTTVNNQPPLLTGITPSQVFIGNEVSISITGNNLLQAKSVTTDNPGIKINTYSLTNNSINIDAHIPNTAPTGPANFTVQTLSGSASISLNLLNLTFSPAQVSILNGASASITTKIDGLTSDYKLDITNQNPNIIQAPQSLTVPVAGSATLIINGISLGAGVIAGGNSGMSVYVGSAYTGPVSPNSKLVSVKIMPSPVQAPADSLPISVNITPSPIQGQENSSPVSVNITPQPVQGPANSLPVSAGIGNATGY